MFERRILITGAASGIGAASCRALAGPKIGIVVHTRRHRAGAEATAAAVRARGGEACVILGDLTEATLPERLVATAAEWLSGLDVVIANAGFADATPTAMLSDTAFSRSFEAIAAAFLRLARAAGRHLKGGREARLIAVSSFAAHVFRTDLAPFPASAAAKAAVEALVRVLALEWAPKVTVNAVVPGYTRKDPGAHSALSPQQWEEIAARIPLRRLATPDEVAALIAFLASPVAGYITGQTIHISGGLVM